MIETRGFYTIEQLAEFMDVNISQNHAILVNSRPANMDTLVYENFTIDWVEEEDTLDIEDEDIKQEPEDFEEEEIEEEPEELQEEEIEEEPEELQEEETEEPQNFEEVLEEEEELWDLKQTDVLSKEEASYDDGWSGKEETSFDLKQEEEEKEFVGIKADGANEADEEDDDTALYVTVNGDKVKLTGKEDYIFVDIFSHRFCT